MKIIVTGAAGFIGSHCAERLAGLGHEIIGIDCFTQFYDVKLKEINARDIEAKGVKIIRLDLATDDLSDVLKGVESVFHFAAQPGLAGDEVPIETYIKNNIIATDRLVRAVKDLPSLTSFINICTSSVYGAHATDAEDAAPKPTSYYGVTKLAAEQLVLAYHREEDFPACSLRLFSIYGPRERPEKLYPKLIMSMLKKETFPLFEGSDKHIRSYTYIGDVIDGFMTVFNNFKKCNGEIYNIGIDSTITTGEGIKIVEKIMGQKANIDIKPKRYGDQLETHANINKIRNQFGFNPKTTPEQGLQEQVKWFQEKFSKEKS